MGSHRILRYAMLSDDEKIEFVRVARTPSFENGKVFAKFENAHDEAFDPFQTLGINWDTFKRTFGLGNLIAYQKYISLALPALVESVYRAAFKKNRAELIHAFFAKVMPRYGCDTIDLRTFPGAELMGWEILRYTPYRVLDKS